MYFLLKHGFTPFRYLFSFDTVQLSTMSFLPDRFYKVYSIYSCTLPNLEKIGFFCMTERDLKIVRITVEHNEKYPK